MDPNVVRELPQIHIYALNFQSLQPLSSSFCRHTRPTTCSLTPRITPP
jgi:hypothetical protein